MTRMNRRRDDQYQEPVNYSDRARPRSASRVEYEEYQMYQDYEEHPADQGMGLGENQSPESLAEEDASYPRRARYSAKIDSFLNNGILIVGFLLFVVLVIAFLL